jgi:GntR family transcriptional regulator, transcriptional repressor for pyruvate dehydrogenase complex
VVVLVFKPIKTRKIYEEIVDQLKIMLTDGELRPGDKLPSERDMSESLGVSRASVREALTTLEAIGILEIKPGEGTFVRETSDAETFAPLTLVLAIERNSKAQLMEVRRVLETEMAALAAERASSENLYKIQALLDVMKGAHNTHDAVEADLRFHFAIAEASQNTILLRLINTIADLMHHTFQGKREKLYAHSPSGQRILHEHEAIYQAIKNRDPQKARDKMLEHINHVEIGI